MMPAQCNLGARLASIGRRCRLRDMSQTTPATNCSDSRDIKRFRASTYDDRQSAPPVTETLDAKFGAQVFTPVVLWRAQESLTDMCPDRLRWGIRDTPRQDERLELAPGHGFQVVDNQYVEESDRDEKSPKVSSRLGQDWNDARCSQSQIFQQHVE